MSHNLEKLQRISDRMKKICSFLMVAFPIALVLNWSNLEFAIKDVGFLNGLRFEADFVGADNLMLGFLIDGILTVLAVLALINLRRFFSCGSEGRAFSSDAAVSLHRFSKFLISYALLMVPIESVLSYVVTKDYGKGERVLQISLSSTELALIFLGFVFFAISWLLKESVLIAEENAQII